MKKDFSFDVWFVPGQIVAVKQLDRSGTQGNQEFIVEVSKLTLLKHQNLVNLLGYCADGDQRILVYEYMPMGCLNDHLLGKFMLCCLDSSRTTFGGFDTHLLMFLKRPNNLCLPYSSPFHVVISFLDSVLTSSTIFQISKRIKSH